MVIFLYNPYIFVQIEHSCLAYIVFALDLSNSVVEVVFSVNKKKVAQISTIKPIAWILTIV